MMPVKISVKWNKKLLKDQWSTHGSKISGLKRTKKSLEPTAVAHQPLHSIPKLFFQRHRVHIYNSQRLLFPGALVVPAELEETGKKNQKMFILVFAKQKTETSGIILVLTCQCNYSDTMTSSEHGWQGFPKLNYFHTSIPTRGTIESFGVLHTK